MRKISGLLVEVALLVSVAVLPAMAIRPDAGNVSPSNPDGENPYRRGLKKLKKISPEDFLEAGQSAKSGKVLLNGDAAGQASGRLTARLRKNGSEARTVTVQTDGKGNRHIRMLQYHKGIPVIGSDMVVHVDAGNAIYAAGGKHAPDLKHSENPKLTPSEAGAAALAAVEVKKGAVERQSPRLVIFDDVLAYEVEIKENGKAPKLWRTYIDAKTGSVLFRENRIIHGAPVGGAAFPVQGSRLTGEDGAVTPITGWRDDNGVHFLRNNIARWGVYDQDRFDWSQNATADWGTTDRAAISLAKNIETTRNYVATVLGRNGYDNAGAFVNAYAHEGSSYVNAYWDGSGLYFGDGDGVTANPLTVLDVAAHEYGHAITQYTSGLTYSYESGALNESYSDIMGALVEFWAQPDGRSSYPAGADGRADYLVGEDCWLGADALRDMRNPLRFGSPSYYLGTSWNGGSGDNGGVHTNSGVQNFAFYLLAEGGTGSNDGHAYSINGLGTQAAGEIALYANMYLLTSSSQYRDAREAWIMAAATLGRNVQTVRDVWTACGVMDQVNNLAVSPANLDFGSVGVGSPLVLNLTLSNNGALPTTVTGGVFSNSVYSATAALPLTVPGGGSVSFPVRFSPVAPGVQTGQVTLTSNADDNPTLTAAISGTGASPAVISINPASINAATAVGDSVTRIVSVTNTGGADLYVTASAIENQSLAGPLSNQMDVLFLSAGTYFPEFENQLRALANVQSLTRFDGSQSTPTLAQLQAYDAVIVASGTSWNSPPALGDVLADYADAGGGIVLMGATFHIGGSWLLEGRIMTPAYAPLAAANYSYSTTVTSTSLATHAINQGVTSITSGLYALNTAPQGGGISLGAFTGGYLVGAAQTGKAIVSLNAYPQAGYYGGDLVVQVGNALNHVGSGSWLSVANDGVPIRIVQGGVAAFQVKMSAAHILGGTYTGSISLNHNAIATANPLVIPVTFAVDGFRRLSAAPATLAFGTRMAGSSTPLTLTLTNTGDEATSIASIQSDNPAFAVSGVPPTTLPGGQTVQLQVVFTPPAPGAQSGVLTITSNAEDNPSLTVALNGVGVAAPSATLAPSAFTLTLTPGQAPADRLSTLANVGGSGMTYRVASVSQTGSPLPPPALASLPAISTGRLYADSNYDHAYVPGRVIVAFKPGYGGFADSRTPASVGIRGTRELAAAVNPKTRLKAHAGRKLVLLEIQDAAGVRAAIDIFRQDANVAYAEPDFIQKAVAVPNDPSFNLLYGMHNTGQTGGVADADIDAPEAWNRHTGNRSILIGVIDTGIDYAHPDLAANIWTNPGEIAGNNLDDDGNGFIDDVHGWDFAYDDANPTDGHYHGTHCAGTIAGIGGNAVGVAGVMWTASVVALKFLDDGGSGTTSDAIDAVNYANAMDIRITSNSWGGGGFSQALMDAIAGGGLFVAAAGNSGSDNDVSPQYPASYDLDNIVSVAATDHSDALASFSCYGATTVDLGAPGVDIYSAAPGGSYQYLSGTSMATPHVSGAAGLVWSFNPSLTAAQVKAALMTSANPIPALAGRTVTGGRLNVNGALDEAGPSWLTAAPTTPGTLAPGETAPVTVTVDPSGLVAGRWTGVVNVATNDPIHPELPITIAADITGCRSLAVVPGAFDFGAVWVGTTARTTFTLRNACNDATTLTSMQFGRTEFRSLASLPLSVPAFGEAGIEVEFIPAAAGAITATLTLATNADTDPVKTVALSGSGVIPPRISASPGAFAKTMPVGETRTDVLNISNQGGADLQWSAQFILESMPAGAAQAALARHQANLLPPAAPNYLNRKPGDGPQAGLSGQPPTARPALSGSSSGIGVEAWNPLRAMTSARSQFGLAAPGNGKVYAFGGWDGTTLSNSLEIYDIAANSWTAGAPVPVYDRGIATATGPDGVIYYIGGTQSSCYKYDTRTNAWSSIATPPQTSIWEASAITGEDGRIYVFGGGSFNPVNAVQIYDPATNGWTLGAPMPTARAHHGAAKIAGGLMLIAGGFSNGTTALTTAVDIYNPTTNTWSAATPMPVTRNQFGIATGADGKVYVIGGKQNWYNNYAPFFSTVWAYDPASGAWSEADSLSASLGELEAVTAGGVIFAAGGTNGTYSAAMQTLQTVGAVTFTPASGIVPAGQSIPVTVTFDARGLRGGLYSGSLRIAHNDPVGANPLAVPVTMTVDGMRRLSSATAGLDFGNVWAAASRSLNLRLDNTGDEATVISGIASGDTEFTVTGSFPITLAPGASLMVPVVFRPMDLGAETAVLTILSNAEDNPSITVALSGTGTAPPVAQLTPSSLTFDLAPSDAPADRTATLANVGGDILAYQIVSVAETGSPLLRENPPVAAAAPAAPDLAKIYAAGNYGLAHAPGEVIVALKPGFQNLSGPALFPALGVTEVKELATARNPRTGLRAHGGRKLLLIKMPAPDASSLAVAISRLKADANVAYAEPNYVRTLGAIPNDPGFANLYGMHNTGQSGGLADADIDAPEAWDRQTGNRSLVLGLIDTGIDYLHPDLAANVWTNPGEIAGNGLDDDGNGYVDDIRGYDFINNDGDPMDDHYHGTHCAGTIAGVGGNGIGVAGVAWTASVAGLKIFNSSGSTTDAAILNAVDYSNAMGMRITSNSWGGGPYSQSLFDLIAEGLDLGHLFIAAAGNNGSNTDVSANYPSGFDLPNIISVAATDRNDLLAGFSNYGALTVDLGAPGVDTYSCAPGGGYQNLSGTSMATPHVSGAAYLVLSANPSLTGAALKAILLGSVDPIPSLSGRTVTGGRLNVAKALEDAGSQWLTATPTAPDSLAPGASRPLTITVDPSGLAAGVWTGVVTVASNDPVRSTLPLTVTATISGCRSLSISPASHGFGPVFVGASAQTTLTLSNACNDAVTVSAFTSSHAAFTGSTAAPFTIPAFGQATMSAVFRPTAAGAASAILTFTTNADTNPIKTVDLTGTGIVPPNATVNPDSISRTLSSGASTVANLDIGNSGGSVLDWSLSGVDGSLAPIAPYDATHFVPMAKGQADARAGRPVLEATGGPDAAGYRWSDSDAPGGPAFQWTDIRATGTLMTGISSCDDCYQFQTLSFPFTLYGTAFTSMYVTSNGYLSFGTATSQYSNYPLPSPSMPGNLVAGFFDDLYTGGTGDVYFQDMGNRAIIQFQDVERLSGDGTVTFQIVLNADGTILLYYLNVTGNLLSATTGIQNASGAVGLSVQYNTAYLKNNLAVRLGVRPEWLHASVLSGTVQPGATQQIQLTLNSTTLPPGLYTQTLTLGHNNPLEASLTIPVTLTVESAGRVSRILRIGPSSLPMAAGGPYYLMNMSVGGEARGITRGNRYTLFMK